MTASPLDFHLTRRDWAVGLLVVLLAFTFRAVIIFDRADAPNAISAFDPLPVGSDQRTYYNAIAEYRAGTFPPPTYHYQPGMLWYMVGSSRLLDTDSLGVLRLFQAALAALNVGLFMATARLAFGRRWVAALAALLLAIYPVSAFYDTDFVITSQATILLNAALLGVLLVWRRGSWGGVLLYGVSFGLIAITRRELLALAPVFGLWLLWQRRQWRMVVQIGLAAALCVAVMLPIIVHNRSNGADFLITPVSSAETYRGNNRDANGAYHVGPASLSTSQDYMKYLWLDIRLSPRRYAELVLHKIGMFLSSHEPGNNLNYLIAGEGTSALLRAVPLSFQALLALFLFGLFAQARRRDPLAVLLGVSFLVVLATELVMWVEARVRTPVVVFMIPAAAYGLVEAAQVVYEWAGKVPVSRRSALSGLGVGRLVLVVVSIAAILSLSMVAEADLPRAVTVDHLPESAQAAGAVYDDTLELVGWEVQADYSRPGIIVPFSPYVVTLYWRLLQPTTVEYAFGLLYVIDGQRIIVEDHKLGSANYPFTLTPGWEPGRIYVEHVGLTYKRFDDALGVSGDLLLSVYREWQGDQPLPAVGVEGEPEYLRLAQPAIMYGGSALPEGLPGDQPVTPFGDQLRLVGWRYPADVAAGQPVEVTLGWETTGQPILRSYILAVYAFDEQQQVVAQADSPPHDGRLLTSSLPLHYQFGDVKTLALPGPGTYTLYTAVYDVDTRVRLDVPDSDDDLLPLGTITVVPGD